jgi:hypothetical protein
MKIIFGLLTIILFSQLPAQNLSGVWVQEFGGENARLVIAKIDGHYIGYTYDEGGGSFCKANFTGSFDSSRQRLKGLNTSFIDKGFLHTMSRYNLNYEKGEDGKEYLKGTLFPKGVGMMVLSFGMPKFIRYKKLTDAVVDTTELMQAKIAAIKADTLITATTFQNRPVIADTVLKQIAPTVPAELIQAKVNRLADTLTTIRTRANTITVKIMDNGVVDGDTISILHNGKILVSKLGVKLEPAVFIVDIGDIHLAHEITLIAHNLGSIPPNTALVVIEAGDKTYRLTASTDLQRNSVLLVLHDEDAP